MSEIIRVVMEETKDNNDPDICSFCENTKQWPNCMKNVVTRGYHSIFKASNYFDITSCDNHQAICPED
jgi:hypothetical protein